MMKKRQKAFQYSAIFTVILGSHQSDVTSLWVEMSGGEAIATGIEWRNFAELVMQCRGNPVLVFYNIALLILKKKTLLIQKATIDIHNFNLVILTDRKALNISTREQFCYGII
ncbi:MAG: hypothetical protein BRC43_08280 [Cyanobacteria bacterium QS_3_48_167]|nr:MAG: hypothetical protein BRC43_08280 [Cyanobacteria bacterium QS_3_48_167]